MPRWLRFGWSKVDAKLIDRRDFMVELADPPKRLVIREKTFKVDLPENGNLVPLLVNRRRTKAVFDLDDPRIDAVGRLEAKQRRRRERDEERFRAKLGE